MCTHKFINKLWFNISYLTNYPPILRTLFISSIGLTSINSVYVLMMIIKNIEEMFHLEGDTYYPKLFASPMSHLAYNMSIYLTVLLAFERYLQVCFQSKARSLCTPKKTQIYIVAIFLVCAIYTMPRFFQRKLDDDNRIFNNFKDNFSYEVIFLTWARLVFRFIIPTICLAFFNFCIFMKVNMIRGHS